MAAAVAPAMMAEAEVGGLPVAQLARVATHM